MCTNSTNYKFLLFDTKVAWLGPRFRQLTLDDKSVVDDQRMSVFRLHSKEWNLRIRDAQLADAGKYRCTVRNEIVLSKVVTLNVQGELF